MSTSLAQAPAYVFPLQFLSLLSRLRAPADSDEIDEHKLNGPLSVNVERLLAELDCIGRETALVTTPLQAELAKQVQFKGCCSRSIASDLIEDFAMDVAKEHRISTEARQRAAADARTGEVLLSLPSAPEPVR